MPRLQIFALLLLGLPLGGCSGIARTDCMILMAGDRTPPQGTFTVLASSFASTELIGDLDIQASDPAGAIILNAHTDSVGVARFSLPPGKTLLTFKSPFYRTKTMTITVAPGLECRVMVSLLKDCKDCQYTG